MMDTRQKLKRAAGVLLALVLAFSACSGEEETAQSPSEQETAAPALSRADVEAGTVVTAGRREESVFIRADASGKPEKVTAEILLAEIPGGDGEGGVFVRDDSGLTEIKNTDGDEDWVTEGGTVWFTDRGGDIRYEGSTQKEVPFGVRVTYFLEGKETDPAQMAGATGEVRIRFDYTNATGTGTGIVPAAAMTAVFLPENTFSDVEVENGTLLSLSGQNAAVGLAFPGLADALGLENYEPAEDVEIPDYVEIKAHAEHFKLSFTATVFSTGFFESLSDEDLDGLLEIPDDMRDLSDASKELADGTAELYDGVSELADGLDEYFDGVSALRKGAKQLKKGTAKLAEGGAALNDGAKGLEQGLKELNESLKGMDVSGLTELSELDLSQLTALTGQVDLAALADSLEPVIGPEQAAALRNLQTALSGLGEAAEALQQAAGSAGELAGALTSLKGGVKELYKGSRALSKGIASYTEGVAAVDSGAGELYSGVRELDKASGEVRNGMGELLDGVGELRDGVREFDEEGIQELTKLAGDSLRSVLLNVKTLRKNDAACSSFTLDSLPEGTEGSVRFIVETAEIR